MKCFAKYSLGKIPCWMGKVPRAWKKERRRGKRKGKGGICSDWLAWLCSGRDSGLPAQRTRYITTFFFFCCLNHYKSNCIIKSASFSLLQATSLHLRLQRSWGLASSYKNVMRNTARVKRLRWRSKVRMRMITAIIAMKAILHSLIRIHNCRIWMRWELKNCK